MGPSYGWRYPWGMHHMWRGLGSRMMWIDSFPMMDGFLSDDLNEDYIPAGKARVTAYVRVEYKVAAA